MMKLVDLTWVRYRVPFRGTFHTAHGVLNQRYGVLVSAHTDDGYTGYGEIAPLPEQSGPDLNEALQALHSLAGELRQRELSSLLDFLDAQCVDGLLPAPLICGLETALLDAYGKASAQRVADLLMQDSSQVKSRTPAPRTRVPVNAVIGGATTEAAVASARAAIAAGFTCLKLKLTEASRSALERVAAVRAAIGPAPSLRLDANEGWESVQARRFLARCVDYNIEYVEQPLPAHDLAGMAALRSITPVPLAIDEALTNLASARRILQTRAADVLILKPQLVGGPRICRRIIQEASTQDVACVITSTLETGIGVTMALHLAAASPEISLPCGLATLDLLADDLLQTDLPLHQGALELPGGPGLGVNLDQAALKRFEDKKSYDRK